jgi:4-hydroxybenzoate polyprenyltransferase
MSTLALIRPRQWVKNSFVLAPLLFSGMALDAATAVAALMAALAFCALASGVYAFNDIVDVEADRAHPTKRLRPVASGALSPRQAGATGGILLLIGLGLGFSVNGLVAVTGLVYVALNIAYTWKLKHVVLLDVFTIASFFVLRLFAGSFAIGVFPSIWLLLCGGLLALYLGFAKRRHELGLLGDESGEHRKVLKGYGAELLDQMSVVLLSVTVVSYIMYTLVSDTAALVGSDALVYSTPLVLYGIFRYLYLVHQHDRGSPTETLLTDPALMTTVFFWLVYCGWVVYGGMP